MLAASTKSLVVGWAIHGEEGESVQDQLISEAFHFARIPHALIIDERISHTAFRVWCYLMRRADNDTSVAFPSTRLIAAEIHMSRTTVQTGVKLLEEAGWLGVERRREPGGEHSHNVYVLWHNPRQGVAQPLTHPGPIGGQGGGPTDGPQLDPVITTPNELDEAKPRKRNELWDYLTTNLGEPFSPTLQGKLVAELRDAEVDVAELDRIVARMTVEWGTKAVTIPSIRKHYARFRDDVPAAALAGAGEEIRRQQERERRRQTMHQRISEGR